MAGKAIRPMAITEAETKPVMAESTAPTMIVAYSSPPGSRPNRRPRATSMSSATPVRSRIRPMSTNSGTARKLSLLKTPCTRSGMFKRNA